MSKTSKLWTTILILVIGPLLVGCETAPPEESAALSGDSVAIGPPISLADIEGTWNMVYTPVSGDPALTTSQIEVTAEGWKLLLPDRDPVQARVSVSGDSLVVVEGPYESIGRPGTTVTMHSVYRLDGERLVGVVAARYGASGADSPIVMMSEGMREPSADESLRDGAGDPEEDGGTGE